MTEEVTNPDLRSQDERQLDLIRDLNSRVPSNPQGDAADAGLKKILQSLSKNSLSDALRDSFSADKLKEWKEYAEKEFEAMGQINRGMKSKENKMTSSAVWKQCPHGLPKFCPMAT